MRPRRRPSLADRLRTTRRDAARSIEYVGCGVEAKKQNHDRCSHSYRR